MAAQIWSPPWIRSQAHAWPVVGPAGSASCTRSSAHARAKPVFRTPPGYSVVSVLSITDIGVIAARLGGRVEATKSWLMPPKEIPSMPTFWCITQGWRATVSTTS